MKKPFGSIVVLSIFICLLLGACEQETPSLRPFPDQIPVDSYDLQQEYLNAVMDARVVEPDEISSDFVAVVAYNTDLVWEGEPGNSRILVVVWTNKPYYDDCISENYTFPRSANVWVTAVPELQDFFNDSSVNTTTLRTEQLLGLPPHYQCTKVRGTLGRARRLVQAIP